MFNENVTKLSAGTQGGTVHVFDTKHGSEVIKLKGH